MVLVSDAIVGVAIEVPLRVSPGCVAPMWCSKRQDGLELGGRAFVDSGEVSTRPTPVATKE